MQSQIAEGYDLSPQQRRLWLRCSQAQSRVVLKVSGPLDLKALRCACELVAGRHEALRTTFYRRAGMLPLQVVGEKPSIGWAEEGARATTGNSAIAENPDETIRLTVRVKRLGDAEHDVELSLPALCADAASLRNLVGEIVRCYGSANGSTAPSDEPVSYIQFSEWERELLESEDRSAVEGKAFWRRRNVRSFPILTLPFEAKQKVSDKLETNKVTVTVEAALMAEVERHAQLYQSTVESYLLGCWATLLSRLCDRVDVGICERVSGRKYAELEGAVGLFEKWLPLQVGVNGESRLCELVEQIETTRREGRAWDEYFLWEDEGDDGPGCACGFDYESQAQTWCADTARFAITELSAYYEQFKLRLSCRLADDGSRLTLHSDANLYALSDTQRMASALLALVESSVRTPEVTLSHLNLLDEKMRTRLVDEFNQTRECFAGSGLVYELFEAQASRSPDAVAVVSDDKSLTYAELNSRANQLARRLRSLGVGPEVVVGIMVERSVDVCVALLGVMKSGGAFLPIDPKFPKQRITFMLEDTRAPVLVVQSHLLEGLPEYGGHVVCLDTDWKDIARESTGPLARPATGDNLVYVIFTSGSTGRPKGVAVEHRQLFNYVNSVRERLDLPVGGSYAMLSTFAADLGNTALYPALCWGGQLHIISQDLATDAEGLADYFSRHPMDCLKIVPSHFAALLSVSRPERIVPRKRLILGGEAASRELAIRAKELTSECEVMNHYGPTETTVGVLTFRADEQQLGGSSETLPLGRPIANTQVYVLDAHMQPVSINVPGEIYIGGAGLARGYLDRPELTAERFVPDLFATTAGGRLYRTGDLGRRLESGVIEFLGRCDEQVKFHGYRVELGELRAALNRHPRVRDSVVVMRQDASGGPMLVAYYVARQELTAGELRQFMLGQVVSEVVPQAFVHLRRLPLTLNGKVNFDALPSFKLEGAKVGEEYVGPRTPVEEVVGGVWSEVLGLERVGVGDNFFELGGHSLLATQVVSRLREACGVELPLRTLFEAPTIEGLSRWITAALNSGQKRPAPPILRSPRGNGRLPLSFAQQRLWFLHQLEPESDAYNVFGTVRFGGWLEYQALERSLSEVIRRHEVLRTTFAAEAGQPVQVIGDVPKVRLEAEDVSDAAEARRLAAEEAQRPFDLERGPLYRIRLLRFNENDHILFYTMHHIVSDGWSMGLLFKEVAGLYEAYRRGEESPLPELAIQYADYAWWQREWLQEEVIEEQVSYWQRQLSGAPGLTELPADRERAGERSYRGDTEYFQLPGGLAQQLRGLSRRENATLFMTLLAGFAALLHRRTGQTDLVLGTDVANRTRPEVEQLIGFFINQLALRVDVTGDPSFVGLVRRVREVCLGAYAHQELPFERVVSETQGRRAPGETPLFQVLFVVQNAPSAPAQLPDLSLTPMNYDSPTSKFDLGVFVTETAQGLAGIWRYSTDLFEAQTIQRLGREYETLLQHAVERPEARLSKLDILTEEEKDRQKLEKQKREEEKFKRLKSRRREAVTLSEMSLVTTELLAKGEKLPLVMKPAVVGLDLVEWATAERLEIERLLLENGAVLFRGFGQHTPERFEQLAAATCSELFDQYGDLPRASVSGKIYGSTPYPPEQAILFHNESSHLDRWPMKIYFCCVTAASQGGETPIVDCRKVYAVVDPRLKERFERKKLMYVRNFTDGLDVSWQKFFRTESRAAVEEYCRKAGVECEWKPDGLRTRQVRRAVARHPRTGESLFFNQLQLHHVSCLDPELLASVRATFRDQDLPRNVYYGDGSPIEESVVSEICEVYREEARAFQWQEGDVLLLDNMLVAHGRRPYAGERKILVSMGEMLTEGESEAKAVATRT